MVDLFSKACKDFGVTIALAFQRRRSCFNMHRMNHIYVEPAKFVVFVYIGSMMTKNATIDDEISLCISPASASLISIEMRYDIRV